VPAAGTGGAAGGQSLFCFTVVTADGVVPPGGSVKVGYEQPLIDAVKAKGLGIFACEESAVYQGEKCATGEWGSVANTLPFTKIWDQVQADGRHRKHQWTVKTDPDAVFFPDRLRQHLAKLGPSDGAVYVKNIGFKFGFMGALEVLNTAGVDLFLASLESCSALAAKNSGEDKFLMECMNAHGAGHLRDNDLLDDKYTLPAGWHLFDVTPCADPSAVAFHPYKAEASWMGCHQVATGEAPVSSFPVCGTVKDGNACRK